ncbi:MAG: ATP-binding cassette domain-containing protein [Acholeplasmatales bacterium]|nr:ATP-binding cassette domain-containing protein [Acholeplasmatales bacterium]
MNKVLEVKKLKISFRTNNGTVKAVRDISFDLYKGETLAIVGESGSGKSVTSKAILGILAGNSIIDGGEILYDGRDLLKVSEEEMHKLRGDKIAMIFQDPLSSLDPIVKIGKQITEAMLLKNKASRRASRKAFNSELELLRKDMIAVVAKDDKEKEAHINEMIKTFDNFNIQSLKMQISYNQSKADAQYVLSKIEDFLFKASKQKEMNIKDFIKSALGRLKSINNPYFLHYKKQEFDNLLTSVEKVLSETSKAVMVPTDSTVEVFKNLEALLKELLNQVEPNFFRIGYYAMKNPDVDTTKDDIEELNQKTLTYLDENFMLEFLDYAQKAIAYRQEECINNKKSILAYLTEKEEFFKNNTLVNKECKALVKEMNDKILTCVNELDVTKDTLALTFKMSILSALKIYFTSLKDDIKDEKRFNKQTAKRDALIAKGKTVDWKVIPRKVIDENDLRESICHIISRLKEKFVADIDKYSEFDVKKSSVALVDWFSENASKAVTYLTRTMAKEKAIELMEEVGIPEPRIRYYQYPFEFSGGMRQRIVIAIALSANPEILICDEPTTALDVTIQAQILDLINKLKKERNLSIIFITHDLGVVANMADRVAVMYAGKIVELGTSEDLFYNPAHPYTWALLTSMPDLDNKEKLESIAGTPPNMIYPPKGDAFAARNKYALKIDFEKQPPLFKISDTHYAATWLLHPNAPKVEMPKVIQDRIARMKQKMAEDGGVKDGE